MLYAFFSSRTKGVGKSSLIKQYIDEMDPTQIAPTVGVSFSTFKIKLEDGKVKMQVRNKNMCDYYSPNSIQNAKNLLTLHKEI